MTMFSRKPRVTAAPQDGDGASTAPLTPAPQTPALLASLMSTVEVLHSVRTRVALFTGAVPTIFAYPVYGSAGWIRVLARVVLSTSATSTRSKDHGTVRGWRSFTAVPIPYGHVEVQIGDVIHQLQADAGGLVDVVVESTLPNGWHTIVLRMPKAAAVEARIQVVDPEATFGIVSDIDDTVMVTALPRPLLAAWNTLVLSERARTPTPGMAVLLDRVVAKHSAAPILYLSTGAWNVAPALTRFLARNLYPEGVLLLTDWGPSRQHWFRNGRVHKRRNLERLAHEFPHVKWLLVGDDGQHDPETYAEFARNHPEQTAAVAIRQLSASEALLAGGRNVEDALPSQRGTVAWVSAPDGAGLAEQLKSRGIL